MQSSLTRRSTSSSTFTRSNGVAQSLRSPAPFVHRAGRSRNVQKVFAAKSRRGMMAPSSGVLGQNIDWSSQPPPDVDTKNVQFVVFVRNLKYEPVAGTGGVPSYWIPLGPISGGSTANAIVQYMASEWGRKLFGNLIVRNIALGIYKDGSRLATESRMRTNYAVFKGANQKDIQYGFNVRDRTQPKDWYKPIDVTILPPEADLDATPQEAITKFFSGDNIKAMFKMQ